jgi:hypothetical protein
MAGEDVQSVKSYRILVRELLEKAAESKQDSDIESPLTDTDLGGTLWRVQKVKDEITGGQNQQAQYAAVETAFREKFYDLLVCLELEGNNAAPADIVRLQLQLMSPNLFKYGIYLTLCRYFQTTVIDFNGWEDDFCRLSNRPTRAMRTRFDILAY